VPLFDAGRRSDAAEQVHDRLLTVPNAMIAATDWIDGYVARRFDQVSRIGKLVDPLVDRLLLATATITLVIAGLLPWPLLVLILLRDVIVLGVSLVWFGGVPPIPVSRVGKLATALLMIGVPAFLLAGIDWSGAPVIEVIAWAATLAGIVAYYVAAVRYGRVARAIRRARVD
jgi:cardiolipin synthase